MEEYRDIASERVRAWLSAATSDAERRGLPELKAILRRFAKATDALRAADWNSLELPGASAKASATPTTPERPNRADE